MYTLSLTTLLTLALASLATSSPAPPAESALASINSIFENIGVAHSTASGWKGFESAYHNFEGKFAMTQTVAPAVKSIVASLAPDEAKIMAALETVPPNVLLAYDQALFQDGEVFVGSQTFVKGDVKSDILSAGSKILAAASQGAKAESTGGSTVAAVSASTTAATNAGTTGSVKTSTTPSAKTSSKTTTASSTSSVNAGATNGAKVFAVGVAGFVAVVAAL